uniref:Hexosyltransferase n=1 Tax=Panagrolaimus sp. JU765 TaxID=591449 RepID=A0AC34RC74_9BILA
MMMWKVLNCPKADFFFRTNDDSIVNTLNLKYFTDYEKKQPLQKESKKIYGRLFKELLVCRETKYKWYVSEADFNETVYPDFCDGGACIYTNNAMRAIIEKMPETRYFWVDDVLYGGILAQKGNVTLIDRWDLFRHLSNDDYLKYKAGRYSWMNFVSLHVDFIDSLLP